MGNKFLVREQIWYYGIQRVNCITRIVYQNKQDLHGDNVQDPHLMGLSCEWEFVEDKVGETK